MAEKKKQPSRSRGGANKRAGEKGSNTGLCRQVPFDAERKKLYLEHFAEHGLEVHACKAVRVSWQTVRNHRNPEHRLYDPEFAEAFRAAERDFAEKLIAEMRRRGVEGFEEPVFFQGQRVDVIRRHSDRLLSELAKAKAPEFREKVEVETKHSGTVSVELAGIADLSREDRDALRGILERRAKQDADDDAE